MKKWIAPLILGSSLVLLGCNEKDTANQTQMDEAQEMLAQATQLLEQAKQIQQENSIAQQTVKPTEPKEMQKPDNKPLTLPEFEGWVKECVDLRNTKEGRCRVLSSPSEQAACLLGASRDMALCMADHGAAQIQDKMTEQGAELGAILGTTAQQLDAWLQNNEGSLNDIANSLSPFMEQLMQSDNGEVGKNIEELLKNFGNALDDTLNNNNEATEPTPNKPSAEQPEANSEDPVT